LRASDLIIPRLKPAGKASRQGQPGCPAAADPTGGLPRPPSSG